MGTVFSLLIAIFVILHPFSHEEGMSALVLNAIMLVIAIPFLFVTPIGRMASWQPIQRSLQYTTSRIMDMFSKDWHLVFTNVCLVLFPLATILLTIDALYMQMLDKTWRVVVWLVLLGIAIDATRHFVRRVTGYLNPFAVVEMITTQARKSIQSEREGDLCHWIDALSEIVVKGIQHHSIAVSNLALVNQQVLARLFLEASKSIGHHNQDKQTLALGITDKVSYTMFYLYQRLDLAFDQAVRKKIETTSSLMINAMGKIVVDAAKYDISMASIPLRFLGKFAKQAQEEGLQETALTASCTFLEISKVLLTELDITYMEIKDPFLSIINGMEVLAKGEFQRDKTMSLDLLIHPFMDLKNLFGTEKAKGHQDTPVIMQNIDRVLGEFEALKMVMNTIPNLSGITARDNAI